MSKQSKETEFLARIPGFLAAINDIRNRGFFESFKTEVTGQEGKLHSLSISGVGYLPSDQKYMAIGVESLVNVPSSLANVQTLLERKELKVIHFTAEVKSEVWKLWDTANENVIGSKGLTVKFDVSVFFI